MGAVLGAFLAPDISGRPPRTVLSAMCTKAWLAYLKKQNDAEGTYEIDCSLFGPPKGSSVPLYKHKLLNQFPDIRWKRHEKNETSPDETQLALVDARPGGKGSKSVFQRGPMEDGEAVALWCVFEQDLDAMWEVIDRVCPEMPEMRRRDTPIYKRIQHVAYLFVPQATWDAIDFKNPSNHPVNHAVLIAHQNGNFCPTWKLLAAAMAMWRVSLYFDDSMAQMEYLVRGLLAGPCKGLLDLIKPYSIYSEFTFAFNFIEISDHIQRGNLDVARLLVEKMTNASKGAD